MAMYDPLADHLQGAGDRISMSFGEIEDLVGSLPPSARKYRQWWENSRSHVQAEAWMSAGYEVSEVDASEERVVFSAVSRRQ